MLSKLKDKYPVIVVGGGVNGLGIARDCALRGIDCLLVEKGDFGGGTSMNSSGMIHGGPRYMLGDVDVTKLACLDSGYIQKIAPHLLFRIPFLYTVYKNEKQTSLQAKMYLEAVEAFFEGYDRYVPLKNGEPHTRLTAKEVLELEPGLPTNELVGGITFDEWGIDVPRLCIANALDAHERGAKVLNHTKVESVRRNETQITGVSLVDLMTGEKKSVECDLLINTTGPWSQQFGKLAGVDIKIRGGKGIHITFDRRLFNMAVVSQCIDGREIFVMPYENGSILGTTDDDFFGDLDFQQSTDEEIEYLLDGIERVFPAIRKARMIRSWSGVRPTIYERDVYEDDLSREHEIYDHEFRDGVKGMISLVGGKLASYRIMAEETVDLICRKLDVQKSCETHLHHLPGGDHQPSVEEWAKEYNQNPYVVSRMVYRHGSRAHKILNSIKEHPSWGKLICSCEPVTEAEIRYVAQHELCKTMSDVRRRTRVTQGPCQATQCLLPTADLVQQILQKDEATEIANEFNKEWWWNRAICLNGGQVAQEELNQAIHYCNNKLDL